MVEAHAAGIRRLATNGTSGSRRPKILADSFPSRSLLACQTGLMTHLMRLLHELDVLAGSWELRPKLVQELDLRQLATYQRIIADGRRQGVFAPTLSNEMVVLEDDYGLRIVADQISTHDSAADGMRAVAAQLGCLTSTAVDINRRNGRDASST